MDNETKNEVFYRQKIHTFSIVIINLLVPSVFIWVLVSDYIRGSSSSIFTVIGVCLFSLIFILFIQYIIFYVFFPSGNFKTYPYKIILQDSVITTKGIFLGMKSFDLTTIDGVIFNSLIFFPGIYCIRFIGNQNKSGWINLSAISNPGSRG